MGWEDFSSSILCSDHSLISYVCMYACTMSLRHIVFEYGDLEFVDHFRKNMMYTKKCDKVGKLMLVGRLVVSCVVKCTCDVSLRYTRN